MAGYGKILEKFYQALKEKTGYYPESEVDKSSLHHNFSFAISNLGKSFTRMVSQREDIPKIVPKWKVLCGLNENCISGLLGNVEISGVSQHLIYGVQISVGWRSDGAASLSAIQNGIKWLVDRQSVSMHANGG